MAVGTGGAADYVLRRPITGNNQCTIGPIRPRIHWGSVYIMKPLYAAESIRVSSTTFTQSAQKATEFGEIKQLLGHSRSFKVTEFGTNRKLMCDFLLV